VGKGLLAGIELWFLVEYKLINGRPSAGKSLAGSAEPQKIPPQSFTLVREPDARLEMAAWRLRIPRGKQTSCGLRGLHVAFVHPEYIGVVVRVLEAHYGDVPSERDLRDEIHLYGTDAAALDLVGIERVHDPVHVAAVVHVVVHVEVAVVRLLGAQYPRFYFGAQNVHHLGERVLARK